MAKRLFIAAAFAIVFSIPALANYAKDLYAVAGVSASASSTSSSEAKRQAMAKARDKAFLVVMRRLLASEDVERAAAPDSYNMEKFVRKYKINNEKAGSASYSADIDMQIDRELMDEYLASQGFKAAPGPGPATAIIPIPDDGEWRGAFEALSEELSANGQSSLNIVPFTLNSSGAGRAVSVRISEAQGQLRVVISDGSTGDEVSFSTDDRETANVARRVLELINDMYKREVAGAERGRAITAVLSVAGLSDWLGTEKALRSIPEVKGVGVQAMKHNKVQISLEYDYSLDALVGSMRQAGFSVEPMGGYLAVRK